jgi:hypothetical protein
MALGGSITAGAGLSNIEKAYPYQLASSTSSRRSNSNNVHNYAVSAVSDHNIYKHNDDYNIDVHLQQQQMFTSLCTQTIVGDNNMYDVITLEYTSTKEYSSLLLLAKRLRQRYPNSTIIYVQLWTPYNLQYYEDSIHKKMISYKEWRTDYHSKQQQSTNKIDDMIIAMKPHKWAFDEEGILEETEKLREIMDSINGILYRLPLPVDINQSLNVLNDWFVEEQQEATISLPRYYLSSEGHSIIVKDLQSMLEKQIFPTKRRTMSTSSTTDDATAGFGTWGSGDSCQLWYESAADTIPQRLSSRGFQVREFTSSPTKTNNNSNSRYYALEVSSSTSSTSTLDVHNPFDEDRMVYLSYMTTSAMASSKKVYPRTKVQFDDGRSSHIILDPSHDDNTDTTHRVRTTAIGMIRASTTTALRFVPLEEYTVNNFRVVGVSFLAKEKQTYGIPSEFVMSTSANGLIVHDDDNEEQDHAGNKNGGNDHFFFGSWAGGSRKKQTRRFSSSSSSSVDEEDR